MSPFKKVKNFDSTANVLSYAYFQAFKFPDSMNVHFQCVVQVCRSSCPEPQCGGAAPPNVDSYGAPAAAPVSLDSYGSPAAPPTSINPRRPGGQGQYQSGSQRRVSVVRPDAGPAPLPIPLNPEKLVLPQPGYSNFNKRVGLDTNTLGGKPRSLEFSEGEEIVNKEEKVDKKNEKKDEEDGETVVNSVEEEKERRRREATDGNGNRVLQVYRRVRRDAETENETEAEEEVEQADIETQESVIRVVSPTDVQFKLDTEDKEEVINMTSPEALCLDTAAFVGVTISFIMLLVIAAITIVFLWLRIRAIDRKNLL